MSNDSTTERSPFNRWWFIAGGFLVVIAVIAGLLLSGVVGAGKGGGGNAGGNPGGPAASSSPDGNSAEPAGDTCSLPDGSQSIPTSGPKATWKTDVYFQYPSSDQYGPTQNPTSADWGCFAHSPTGALFASANFFRGIAGSDYERFIKSAAVDNAARTSWLQQQDIAQHQQSAGRVAQIAGFQFQSVSKDAAVVSLGFQQSDVSAAMKISLVWDSSTNNWKADFATSSLDPTQADLSGYTEWGASNG